MKKIIQWYLQYLFNYKYWTYGKISVIEVLTGIALLPICLVLSPILVLTYWLNN